MTATASRSSPNKRFNKRNNGGARVLLLSVHFFAVLCKSNDQFPSFLTTGPTMANFSYFYSELKVFVAYSAGASFNTDKHTEWI